MLCSFRIFSASWLFIQLFAWQSPSPANLSETATFEDDPLRPYLPRYRPGPPVKMLFLNSVEDSIIRIDTFFYELYEAAERHPHVDPTFWGPGYAFYSDTESLRSNIERAFGLSFFDIVFMHAGIPGVEDESDAPITSSLGPHTLWIVKAGDCNNNQCVRESHWLHSNLTLVRYAHEALEMMSYERLKQLKIKKYRNRSDMEYQLIGHVPDTANEWDFYPTAKWEDKTVDALLIGKVDAGYYPIRKTVEEGIEQGRTSIRRLPTPPAFLGDEGRQRTEGYHFVRSRPFNLEWDHPRHDAQRRVLTEFAKALRTTKVCVFDGSVEQKAIRKFSQAMLSGCVIASDLVTEHDAFLKENIIELDLNDDIEAIEGKIQIALRDEDELKRKAINGIKYGRQHLTCLRELDLILGLGDRYREGQRGYKFPHGFTSKCRQYHWSDAQNTEDTSRNQFVPDWCQAVEPDLQKASVHSGSGIKWEFYY